MIAVDTSVWISFLRGKDRSIVAEMKTLLGRDAVVLPVPVWIELLGGLGKKDRPKLKRLLRALPMLQPTEATWRLLEAWVDRASSSGNHFGMGDLLIAGLAAENNHALWSVDSDFQRMADLGFVRLHA